MHQKQTLLAIKRYAKMLASTISYQTTNHHGIFFIGLPITNEKIEHHNALLINVEDNNQEEVKPIKSHSAQSEADRSVQKNEHNRLINLQSFSLQAEKSTDIKQLIEAAF